MLSHQSAATVWRLDGIDATPLHVTVPIERNPRSDLVSVHRRRVDRGDVVSTDGLRCTGVVRTLFDLATVLDEVALEAAIESARRRYGTSPAALKARLADADRPPKVLTRVLRELDSGVPAESVLEVRVARLLRAAHLPQPVRQFTIRVFGKRYRLDFAWPEVRLALECDGRAFHEFQRDRTRWRQIGASGWRVLPVTWHDVTTCWPAVLAELTAAFVQ